MVVPLDPLTSERITPSSKSLLHLPLSPSHACWPPPTGPAPETPLQAKPASSAPASSARGAASRPAGYRLHALCPRLLLPTRSPDKGIQVPQGLSTCCSSAWDTATPESSLPPWLCPIDPCGSPWQPAVKHLAVNVHDPPGFYLMVQHARTLRLPCAPGRCPQTAAAQPRGRSAPVTEPAQA